MLVIFVDEEIDHDKIEKFSLFFSIFIKDYGLLFFPKKIMLRMGTEILQIRIYRGRFGI